MSKLREALFNDLFSPEDGDSAWIPNSGQTLLAEMTGKLEKPYMAIVESPTGTGKTEACAYSYALRRNQGLIGTGGLYVGLPTMATTNAMFLRIKSFLQRLYQDSPTSFHLAQSESFMNEDFKTLLARGRTGNGSDETVLAYDWFNGRKRALLARNAVGTVDQIMLASMLTKHQFVRMLGLFDKTVVIDEIHAYDSYMSSIICDLLSWLHAIGTPVVLLSATLPVQMKLDLISAYSGNTQYEKMDLLAGPNITVCTDELIQSEPIPDIPGKPVFLRLIHSCITDDEFYNQITDLLLTEVEKGGCIGCILNTVSDAQNVAERVRDTIDPSIPVLLAHSRFTREDRHAWEQDLSNLLGPKSSDRPERAVIIGTQVLEQSLDIDFDFLISDLAPIDLLIQRAGRLHRHTRERNSHATPVMAILIPEEATFRFRSGPSAVYLPAVLAKSLQALKTCGDSIELPGDDSSLLAMVYDEEERTISIPPDLKEQFELWEEEALGVKYAQRNQANHVSLSPVQAFEYDPGLTLLADRFFDLEDERIATRLGGLSIDVVLLSENVSENADPKILINRSVKVTSTHAVKKLLAMEVPEVWKSHWFLAGARPLVLSNSQASIEGIVFRYSNETGLSIM